MLRKVPQVWSDGSGTDGMTGVGAGGALWWGVKAVRDLRARWIVVAKRPGADGEEGGG